MLTVAQYIHYEQISMSFLIILEIHWLFCPHEISCGQNSQWILAAGSKFRDEVNGQVPPWHYKESPLPTPQPRAPRDGQTVRGAPRRSVWRPPRPSATLWRQLLPARRSSRRGPSEGFEPVGLSESNTDRLDAHLVLSRKQGVWSNGASVRSQLSILRALACVSRARCC
eukprot:SAG25_NODE_390_length_8662_cov_4.211141_2_plen_169_part_00